jgi:transcriptional regulator with XRE-family HTH domain
VFGENVRAQRKVRGWSIELMAKRAGLAPQTVLRIEQGYPSTKKKREMLALALDTLPSRLEATPEIVREDIAIHPVDGDFWISLLDSRPQAPDDDAERIQTATERERLGRLGFVTQFVNVLHCRLPKGKLVGGILEIHGPLLSSQYLGGEVFAYALSGHTVVHLESETFDLDEGQACTLDCSKPFFFEPKQPVLVSGKSCLVLYVRLDEIVSISDRPQAKGPTVEGPAQAWAKPSGQ